MIELDKLKQLLAACQRDIVKIELQIAKEERPRVGDTVQIVPPHESAWWAEEAVVTSARPDGLGLWLKFQTGASAWFEHHRIKVVSRAAPKSHRWYTQEEFISFMFAHPVILVRNAEGYVRTGRPTASSTSIYISTSLCNIDESEFTAFTYSVDGNSWQSFGVEE